MVVREFWLHRIEQAWQSHSVIWLMGVRRAGKTTLARSIPNVRYFDCELPSVRRMLDDPESFLDKYSGTNLVLDEVHRLDNPSEVLKIAADHYPRTRILATGSSTLGASAKFRDTLAGRKTEIWLTPMNSLDLGVADGDWERRMLHGGLPGFYMADEIPEHEFQEWMDAYWAKDIQELFRLERRQSFQRFTELLMTQSGGIFEATNLAQPCGVSRTTISNYLSVLAATFVAHVIQPFSSNPAREIIAAPKVYGFDTGFVCYHRGWDRLRRTDFGVLWEHIVLNEIHSRAPAARVQYWRDKQKHEIDFIIAPKRAEGPIAIECKWAQGDFDPGNLTIFRRLYPKGANYVVSHDARTPYSRKYGPNEVQFIGLDGLIRILARPARVRAAPARRA